MAVPAAVTIGAIAGLKYLDSKLLLSTDLSVLKRLGPLRSLVKKHLANGYSVGQWWEDSVAKFQNREAIVFDGISYTFNQFDGLVNQLANWALSKGYKRGDVISIYMENCPEYIALYLAFAKIGAISALINYNLRLKGLVHCITVANSKAVIFGPSVGDAIAEIKEELAAKGITPFALGEGSSQAAPSINAEVAAQPKTSPPSSLRKGISFLDQFAYIYTSGTTGLPKAAIITHQRMYLFGASMFLGFQLNQDDRIYCVLPLYHSSSCLGVGAMITGGLSFIIRKKFSASNFWREATEFKATVTQYIGELCRYLLNNPPGPFDRTHKIRIAIGNGLRPEIWGDFQDRFNIPQIGEFYGATEGNATLTNFCTTKEQRGAVGRLGFLLKKVTGLKILRFNVENEEVVRGKDGFCIECEPGEAGELVGPIVENNSISRFEGYTDKAATKKKVLHDVFVKGDKYMRTGDLLMRDERGYYHFVDRIGDTFRWKGENVSTTEVAQVLSVFPGITEANVYGVQIPGKDGRACMAGIIAHDNLDYNKLLKHCTEQLPSYAVPMFIRKLKEIEITGTFKHQKVVLRNEGINLSVIQDPILWLNPLTKKYEPYSQASMELITSGKAKL